MAYLLSPIGNDQQCDANGNPLVGGKIYTYVAGSSTAAPTYTDNTTGTQQANPIILNSLGLPASPIWMLGGVALKFVIQDSTGVTLRTIDNVSGINDVASITGTEWIAYGLPPTYISVSSFSIAGDQTTVFQPKRRILTVNTAGTIYASIVTSVYSAGITTITATTDSGVFDAGISSVSYGLLSATNPSVPSSYAKSGANTDITSLSAHPVGKMIGQTVTFQTGSVATGTTIIPFDDTIPQNTEGDQYMSLAITPNNASSILEIDVTVMLSSSTGALSLICALFQDATANALATVFSFQPTATGPVTLNLKHSMTAGTTSATTFKVRGGAPSAGTTTFNGTSGGRLFGGVIASRITIKEILP
jgi:hypothetical protein